jgi:hypothetical protein
MNTNGKNIRQSIRKYERLKRYVIALECGGSTPPLTGRLDGPPVRPTDGVPHQG